MCQYIMLFIGLIFAALYIVFYIIGVKKYGQAVDGISGDAYLIPDIFVVGIAVVQAFKIQTGKKDIKIRNKYAELFGKQYVEFYCMISIASTISYIMLFLPVAFLLGAMTNQPVFVALLLLVSMLLPVYNSMKIDTKNQEQHVEILLDYPNVLSSLALLINAGMMLREAWQAVGNSGTRKLYREMQNVSILISNGYSDAEAYKELAENCRVNEIKKFVSILCQNVERGGSVLVNIMKELSVDAWTAKKNTANKKGENASAKLIIPIMITFVGILMMILVPIVSSISI